MKFNSSDWSESDSQLNLWNSSTKSSTLTSLQLEADPEPIDYGLLYKEESILQLTDNVCDQTQVVASDDSLTVYRTEGTPLNLSLTTSLSDFIEADLMSIDEEKQLKSHYNNIYTDNINSGLTISSNNTIYMRNEEVCDETPLMFSRSSSLGSLSSCDVNSDICQSSVISELSNRTSEVVTPSDLPDSPCQSLPSSPKPILYLLPKDSQNSCQHKTNENINKNNNGIDNIIHENNVFEDQSINYATEGTPTMFSLSTSLSSLHEDLISFSIKDNKDVENNYEGVDDIVEVDDIKAKVICSSTKDEVGIDSKKVVLTVTPPKPIGSSNMKLSISTNSKHDILLNQSNNHSDESEDEDIILQKCIESGMTANNDKSLLSRPSQKTLKTTPNVSANSCNHNKVKENKSGNADQNKRVFVEDTPIELSQYLSSLSSSSIESDDDFDDQKILKMAISTGINKEKRTNSLKASKNIEENNENLKPNPIEKR